MCPVLSVRSVNLALAAAGSDLLVFCPDRMEGQEQGLGAAEDTGSITGMFLQALSMPFGVLLFPLLSLLLPSPSLSWPHWGT